MESVSSKAEDGNTMPFIGESTIAAEGFFEFVLAFTHSCFLLGIFSLILDSPEPHILLFRRPLGTDPQSGRVDPELERKARQEYQNQYRK